MTTVKFAIIQRYEGVGFEVECWEKKDGRSSLVRKNIHPLRKEAVKAAKAWSSTVFLRRSGQGLCALGAK